MTEVKELTRPELTERVLDDGKAVAFLKDGHMVIADSDSELVHILRMIQPGLTDAFTVPGDDLTHEDLRDGTQLLRKGRQED